MRTRMVVTLLATFVAAAACAQDGSWYFAVSGDSRDCGDLIMPKIAQDIASNQATKPVSFFWHLGDYRRLFDIDCDMLKRKYPDYDCKERTEPLGATDMHEYLSSAWSDFITHQIEPFGPMQVFLGIGNHELVAQRTREDFVKTFQKWLTQEPLHGQRRRDAARGISSAEGDTSYHFVHRGVDFIFLDNADDRAFTPDQIVWLSEVLAADAADPSIRAIVVGMHEPLPYSTNRAHAMDASCQGRCSGEQVYDLLFRAQNLAAAEDKRKRVMVLASHVHIFDENIYDTPEHRGQVLPGWTVGTAGAVQYQDTIRYGYLLVEVRPDGSIGTEFRDVTRDSPPLAKGPGAEALTDYCFTFNKSRTRVGTELPPCPCGAVR